MIVIIWMRTKKLLNLNVFVVVLEDFSFGHPGMLLSTGQTE